MSNNKYFWQQRSEKYQQSLEGVLPKSWPKIINLALDEWMYKQVKDVIPFEQHHKFVFLDLGCGYGRVSQEVLADYPNSSGLGLDIADTYIKLYNQLLSPKAKGVVGDLEKLPFKDDSCDVVIMITALMYLTDQDSQKRALKEIFRVLKKDGKFIFIERNKYGHGLITLGGIIERLRGKNNKEIEAVSFANSYLSQMINQTGGRIEDKNGLPFFTIFLYAEILLAKINPILAKPLLSVTKFLDQYLSSWLAPSLYISYAGSNKR